MIIYCNSKKAKTNNNEKLKYPNEILSNDNLDSNEIKDIEETKNKGMLIIKEIQNKTIGNETKNNLFEDKQFILKNSKINSSGNIDLEYEFMDVIIELTYNRKTRELEYLTIEKDKSIIDYSQKINVDYLSIKMAIKSLSIMSLEKNNFENANDYNDYESLIIGVPLTKGIIAHKNNKKIIIMNFFNKDGMWITFSNEENN